MTLKGPLGKGERQVYQIPKGAVGVPLHIPQCPVHGILNQKPGQISFPQRNSPSMGHPFLLSYLAPGRECRDSFPVLSKRSYGSYRPGLGAGCRPPALRRDCSFGPLWYIIGKQESLAGRHHLNHMLKSLLQNVNSAAGSFLAVSSIAGAGLTGMLPTHLALLPALQQKMLQLLNKAAEGSGV